MIYELKYVDPGEIRDLLTDMFSQRQATQRPWWMPAAPAEVKAVDMKLFEGDAHMAWMELSNDIAKHTVAAAAGMDIEVVRASFELVSNSIIELHNKFGHADELTFYLAFYFTQFFKYLIIYNIIFGRIA